MDAAEMPASCEFSGRAWRNDCSSRLWNSFLTGSGAFVDLYPLMDLPIMTLNDRSSMGIFRSFRLATMSVRSFLILDLACTKSSWLYTLTSMSSVS